MTGSHDSGHAVSRRLAPLLWLAFSIGGTIAAFVFPVQFLFTGLLWPLGLITPPSADTLGAFVAHPLTRLYLFVVASAPLFHWAHRFRYTLYDGLQLKHLAIPIVVFCYGSAVAGTVAAAYLLLVIP